MSMRPLMADKDAATPQAPPPPLIVYKWQRRRRMRAAEREEEGPKERKTSHVLCNTTPSKRRARFVPDPALDMSGLVFICPTSYVQVDRPLGQHVRRWG